MRFSKKFLHNFLHYVRAAEKAKQSYFSVTIDEEKFIVDLLQSAIKKRNSILIRYNTPKNACELFFNTFSLEKLKNAKLSLF